MAKKPAPKKTAPQPNQLISVAPAAEYLGIMPRTLQYHVEKGNIVPTSKTLIGNREFNLFSIESLDDLAEKIRPGGQPGKGRPRNSDRDE